MTMTMMMLRRKKVMFGIIILRERSENRAAFGELNLDILKTHFLDIHIIYT